MESKKEILVAILLTIFLIGCSKDTAETADTAAKDCSDQCTEDSCAGNEYVACVEADSSCREELNKGLTVGKCGVECLNNSDCGEAEECISNTCECNIVEKPIPYNLSDETSTIDLYFEDGSPPGFIFDEGRFVFSIVVSAANIGQGTISESYVEIDADPDDFDADDFRQYIKYPLNPGSIGQVKFDELRYMIDEHGPSFLKIKADYCYRYSTIAAAKICIDKSGCGECEIDGEKEVFNSGSPIHIRSVNEKEIGEDEIELVLVVENLNNGLVFEKGERCNYEKVNNTDLNRVWLDIRTNMSGLEIECSDLTIPGFITLENGSAALACTLDTSELAVLDHWFTFVLDYNYMESVEKTIEVRTDR